MREEPDDLEADLQAVYGLDLAGYWRGEISPRRLAVLADRLPPGSVTWARLRGMPSGWDYGDVLLADVYHALTGEAHPLRPAQKAVSRYADRRAALEAQKARLAARKRAQEAANE